MYCVSRHSGVSADCPPCGDLLFPLFMKFLFPLLVAVSSINALASDYSCALAEKVGEKDFESAFAFPVDEGGLGAYALDRSQGGLTAGKFELRDGLAFWQLRDPATGMQTTASFAGGEGSYARMQLIPGDATDYLMMDCQRGEIAPSLIRPKIFRCALIEKVGSVQSVTPFDVPIAQTGHDIHALPKAKIPSLNGWVLAYAGSIVVFITNENLHHGVTTVADWDQGTTLSWHPGVGTSVATVSCAPVIEN